MSDGKPAPTKVTPVDDGSKQMAPEVYVDGLEGVLFGYPTSKLRFVTLDARSEPTNPRMVGRITVVMPTGTLVQTINSLVATLDANKAPLRDAIRTQSEGLQSLLSDPVPSEKKES